MKKMGLNEIRKKFLDFFEEHDHLVESGYSLVPQNDKSLLLINAGMAPLKPYFMGTETPPSTRMATCQKCIRTGDIENIGYTARHLTFFEMLGNFSFGDYFKEHSLKLGWEFSTKVLGLPEDKIWATVYLDDDEAVELWTKEIGLPIERIVRLGKEDNFWEIGVGPCGPCSEIFYDRGEAYGCGSEDCKPGCECDRFLEFWNHVFTQFEKDENGEYHTLEKKNIDTGMGLERVACIMQNEDSVFEIDTIRSIMEAVEKKSVKAYGENDNWDISMRIITDHIRAVSFLVSDGVMPNNEGRGYVLRRLLRRASRHGKLLGIEGRFLVDLVDEVIAVSGEAYPDLVDRKEYIKKIISIEEDRFQQTIDQGLEILNEYINEIDAEGGKVLSGEKAFKLYDTFGFPLDLTKEILAEKAFEVDEVQFNKEMEDQRERARTARSEMDELGWEEDVAASLSKDITSEFVGYEAIQGKGKVLAIVGEHALLTEASKGDKVKLVLDKTCFYPEGGGQAGDIGVIQTETMNFRVEDTKKGINGTIMHIGEILEGSVKVGEEVETVVSEEIRLNTARNHTATHLLHKALKMVLGDHIEQAGSLVEPGRLRFDFTHFQGITDEEIAEVEKIVNEQIFTPDVVSVQNTGIKEAKDMGATALFGEKYGDVVRVVAMGDFSVELCGGTHLDNTSKIGMFKIISESGVAAGVRRIEAVTGRSVYAYMNAHDQLIGKITSNLKTNEHDLENRLGQLTTELKALQKENESLKAKAASNASQSVLDDVKIINGFNVITYNAKNADADGLRTLGDTLKEKLDNAIIVLGADAGGKALFLVMVSDDAIKNGAHAGNIIREVSKVAQGGGGGRPNMAQAGGKDPSKIDAALNKAVEIIEAI